MAHQDQDAEGQEAQRTIEQVEPGEEQIMAQEAGSQGGQEEDEQESSQEVMGHEESDLLSVQQDEQAPGNILPDQPEKEEVPIPFEPV